jgi:hypothetical protein
MENLRDLCPRCDVPPLCGRLVCANLSCPVMPPELNMLLAGLEGGLERDRSETMRAMLAGEIGLLEAQSKVWALKEEWSRQVTLTVRRYWREHGQDVPF